MTTFAAVKRRGRPGTRLLCVANTVRPELDGTERTVSTVQTNGFYWTEDRDSRPPPHRPRYWTSYPKASGVEIVDADTFRFTLPVGRGTGTVTLRFLP
jgi:hypothetical protein